MHWLSFKRRKELVESSLISIIRYGLELVSGGSEKIIDKLDRLQSKCARMILQKGRRDWSRTEGLKTLGWLTVPQMAVEASLRTFLKMLEKKKPQSLYEACTGDNEKVIELSEAKIKAMSKMRRKTWSVRCQRWYKLLPAELKTGDISKEGKKKRLKIWIRKMIPAKGDSIFKGKASGGKKEVGKTLEMRAETNQEDLLVEALRHAAITDRQDIFLEEDLEGLDDHANG